MSQDGVPVALDFEHASLAMFDDPGICAICAWLAAHKFQFEADFGQAMAALKTESKALEMASLVMLPTPRVIPVVPPVIVGGAVVEVSDILQRMPADTWPKSVRVRVNAVRLPCLEPVESVF